MPGLWPITTVGVPSASRSRWWAIFYRLVKASRETGRSRLTISLGLYDVPYRSR